MAAASDSTGKAKPTPTPTPTPTRRRFSSADKLKDLPPSASGIVKPDNLEPPIIDTPQNNTKQGQPEIISVFLASGTLPQQLKTLETPLLDK